MRPTIVVEIDAEHKRQDRQWGADREQNDMIWLTILLEEIGETAKEILEHRPDKAQRELVQATTVAVQWLENMERRERAVPGAVCPDTDQLKRMCRCEKCFPIPF